MKSSVGYHTFSIFQKLLPEEEYYLHLDFIEYMKNNDQMDKCPAKNKGQTIGKIYFYNNKTGIRWLVINRVVAGGLGKTFSIIGVIATITPKVLLNKDYIAIATKSDIQEIKIAFNDEARKISPILGDFDSYSASRGDYCANFCLEELKIPCTSEQKIKLIKMGNIPPHYEERTEYNRKKTTHRKEADPNSFYLESDSVVVNCYNKDAELENDEKHPCENKEDAKNLIRFEIQCKNRKLHAMSKNSIYLASEPESSTPTLISEQEVNEYCMDIMTRQRTALPIGAFLSDTICVEVIDKYFRKIVRSGDYYTLEKARHMIKMLRFRPKREKKLIKVLEMTNDHRGIYKAKSRLTGNDLVEYNQMLTELDKLGINPVTIPRGWGIEHIPNLLNAYYNKRAEVQNDEHRREWERRLLMS